MGVFGRIARTWQGLTRPPLLALPPPGSLARTPADLSPERVARTSHERAVPEPEARAKIGPKPSKKRAKKEIKKLKKAMRQAGKP
jgi:hypothetical protein